MHPFQKFAVECKDTVKKYRINLEKPPKEIGADLALPCFALAKKLKKSPQEIAKDIASGIEKGMKKGLIKKMEAAGPYVNFYADWDKLGKTIIKEILKDDEKYGSANKKEKIMIEYSSPNSNKPLHVGHLRNGSIGMSMANILSFSGNNVIKANLVNDRGIHICKVMVAYEKFAGGKTPDKKSDHFVGDLYVLYHKNEDDQLKKEAYEMLKKWEEHDKKAITLWKKINKWTIEGIKQTYKTFGSDFDVWFFESEFYDKAKPLINEALKKKVFFKHEEGAIVAKLEPELANKVVLRSDGTSTYATNDLPLTKHKFEHFKLNKAIWIVGSEQNLYFQQLFKIFELLGYKWAGNCHHLSHGMVNLPSGKMKSREGTVIDADDLIEEVKELAKKEIKERYPNISGKELEERAMDIGLGAIKYYLLKIEPIRDILFDSEKAVAFEGDTGPYLQYTHARAFSIVKKSKKKAKVESLDGEKEINIIKKLSAFPEIIEKCANELKPNYLANYLSELAIMFNEYYHSQKVIGSENEEARLAMVAAVRTVLRNGLQLLGIKPLEKM